MATVTLPVPGKIEHLLSSGSPTRMRLRKVDVEAIAGNLDQVTLHLDLGDESLVEIELGPRESVRIFNALAAQFGLPAYMK